MSRPSWTAFRLSIAEQLAKTINPEVARRKYTGLYQKPDMSIITFAMLLQQNAPHFNSAHHDRVCHFWDRLLPVFKSGAGKNWQIFDHIHDIVDFMIGVEQSLPNPKGFGSRQ